MERGIANTLHEHLSCNDLLSSVQRGFVKGKSTCTNLLECMNDWTLILQDKSCVRVAYVDFSKAFDTVSHEKLFARLHAYGIQGPLLKWIQKFSQVAVIRPELVAGYQKLLIYLAVSSRGVDLGLCCFLCL